MPQQSGVALTRAMAPCPRLVLLDELFSSLDVGLQAETQAAVSTTFKTSGTTATLVTLNHGQAMSIGDRIGVLQNGCLVSVNEVNLRRGFECTRRVH